MFPLRYECFDSKNTGLIISLKKATYLFNRSPNRSFNKDYLFSGNIPLFTACSLPLALSAIQKKAAYNYIYRNPFYYQI
jgi:hypothetical protein